MPTANPRINLTITPQRYELLTRLAKLQGSSRAGIIGETMELVYPMLERVCVVLEAANQAQQTRHDGLREIVTRTEAELLPLLYKAASQFDLFIEDASDAVGLKTHLHSMDEVQKIMRKAANGTEGTSDRRKPDGGAESGVNPRICNTGVRSTKSPKKQANRRGKT